MAAIRLFVLGLTLVSAEDAPLLRGSNLTKPDNLTLTKSAWGGKVIGKDVLYDKIMGYWVPCPTFAADPGLVEQPTQHARGKLMRSHAIPVSCFNIFQPYGGPCCDTLFGSFSKKEWAPPGN